MKKRMLRSALATAAGAAFVVTLAAPAGADQSGNAAISCFGFGNPGQAAQLFGAAARTGRPTLRVSRARSACRWVSF